jgi:hypothetical protein
MKVVLVFLIFRLAVSLYAEQAVGEEDRSRFRVVDIYLDSKGAPLAAYQLEFSITNSYAKIIGIEGGESAAFRQPPFYDPKAMQRERVILAAFSTAAANDLPHGKTRVASIHLQCSDSRELQAELKLRVAANFEGAKIFVETAFEERKTP